MVLPLDIQPATPTRGAWLVPMRYSGPNRRAEYPVALADEYCQRVVHDPAKDAVECPLLDVGSGAKLPVGRWDPKYEWPSPPAEPPPKPAPVTEQAALFNAAAAMRAAMTPAVIEHLQTHPPDDPLCEALNSVDLVAREVLR